MILKALYDYYHRSKDLPAFGTELKEIGFIVVIDKCGKFLRFEDRRIDKKSAQQFLVKKSVDRTSAPAANYLYDNSQYVFGYSYKGDMDSMRKYFNAFQSEVCKARKMFPDNGDIKAVYNFYQQEPSAMVEMMQKDPLWQDITKNLNKKFSNFSFLIDGDEEIVASKRELFNTESDANEKTERLCLVTGERHSKIVETTTSTMIKGSQATAKLVAFQLNSGYDSYGKSQGYNAPISEEAEFAYTTALNHLLRSDSRNKFMVGSRTFLFWASSDSEAAKRSEDSLFALLGRTEEDDDPNRRIQLVRSTFLSVYNGTLPGNKDDRFFILGLAPNSARIAVIYWDEVPLREFARLISKHFEDMKIVDTRKDKKPYVGLHSILGTVTLGGKLSNASPNLPDTVVKSIFQGLPYPDSLFQACIRRIRAEQSVNIVRQGVDRHQRNDPSRIREEQSVNIVRAAIIKAYLNRLNNNKTLNIMLDKENQNQGYLCGRLFAVLDKIQEEASDIHSIRKRYMNSASATPATVFSTILNLSSHHIENLNGGRQVFYEKLKQEIISKLNSCGFPTHLDLQDQGRFFVGYYHQRQDLFISKENKETVE